jgi:uncharacterized membrane protein
VFLFLIDHVGRSLRPSGIVRRVTSAAHEVIEEVYPRLITGGAEEPRPADAITDGPGRTVVSRHDGIVQAVDVRGLIRKARRTGALIELVPQVGDFVATGGPLFRVYGERSPLRDHKLRACLALGQERTHEQDPAFSLRIIVDVACKALSPAVNDPTTAVTAIDYLHTLLGDLGARHLDDGCLRDRRGKVRVLYRTPGWADYVRLAVTEIRLFGAESIQVARRLRAMIEGLIESLPPERATPLRAELKLLRRTTARCFDEPEDRALAEVGDQQGVGGAVAPDAPG